MRTVLILLFIGISNVVFAQNIPTQTAYKGGQGSGYAKGTGKVTIGISGNVETDFFKPVNNIIGSNNEILFSDSLQDYEIKVIAANGKEVEISKKERSLFFPSNVKAGYYWLVISNSTRKETYKVVKP